MDNRRQVVRRSTNFDASKFVIVNEKQEVKFTLPQTFDLKAVKRYPN